MPSNLIYVEDNVLNVKGVVKVVNHTLVFIA